MKTSYKLLALSVLIVAGLASCKKDFTCSCSLGETPYIHYDYTNMTEETAKASCAADEALLEQETAQNIDCTVSEN